MDDATLSRFLIRRGRESELDRLWLLRTDAIRAGCAQHYSPEVVAAWSSVLQPNGFANALTATEFLVAEDHNILLGFGFFDPTTSRLEALFVAPNAMRAGVGSTLVRELEKSARSRGCSHIDLQATLNAELFYARLGYTVVRRTIWPHPNGFELPCVEMCTSLAGSSGDEALPNLTSKPSAG